MLTKQFKEAMPIIETLTTAGYDTYFVGGCVRDLLLQKRIKDIDIASAADPSDVMALFKKVIPVGLEHGTVIVRWNQQSYEVTTFRQDGSYTDQRRPDQVEFVKDVKEDLKRRDFTINALAMDKNGVLIDLFHGQEDLNHRLIRTVGSAEDRFLEDPLRIIRALRFSSELGFTIEEETLKQMDNLAPHIQTLATERLLHELTRFFQGEHLPDSLPYLLQTKIGRYLPVFNAYEHLLRNDLTFKAPFPSFASVLVYFHLKDESISLSYWVKQWKCSNKIKRQAINLLEAMDYFTSNGMDNWLVYQLDESNFASFAYLLRTFNLSNDVTSAMLKETKNNLTIKDKQDVLVNGHAILRMFPTSKPGPWIREIVYNIEKRIVMNELDNDKNTIKEWIRCHRPETN